jgi:hypothetical protein
VNWRKYVGFVGLHIPPEVYTFSIWGNNVSTLVGLQIESFANVSIIRYINKFEIKLI